VRWLDRHAPGSMRSESPARKTRTQRRRVVLRRRGLPKGLGVVGGGDSRPLGRPVLVLVLFISPGPRPSVVVHRGNWTAAVAAV
jgi:hypothetical protein